MSERYLPKTRTSNYDTNSMSISAEIPIISPTNFSEQVNNRKNDPVIETLLQPDGELFLCQAPNLSTTYKRVWIIDGDDTLWEDNIYYEELASEFADLISRQCTVSSKEIRDLLDNVEHEIIPQHGFGPLGFKLSLEETFRRLNESNGQILRPNELLERVIPLLSGVPYNINDEVVSTLNELRSRGDGLVLFTQGPIEIQQGKIARSRLASLFHALAVGSNKHDNTYQALLDRLTFNGNSTIVVGNSLSSEVAPALRLGLEAVHFENPNSWHAVNNFAIAPNSYRSIRSLTDLTDLQF